MVLGVKIEKPDTLFGRHKYFKEQALFNKFMVERDKGLIWISSDFLPIHIPLEHIVSEESRAEKARVHLCRARKLLEEIGV